MSLLVRPNFDASLFSDLLKGGIASVLEKTGRLPPVSLVITPLDGSPVINLDRFLTYSFNSSILVPVDTFSFSFAAPDMQPFYELVKEGDLVNLYANDVPLATGIIDTIDIETDESFGEKVQLNGRDLMAQLEDQDAVSEFSAPIWSNSSTIGQSVDKLIKDTRIKGRELKSAPGGSYLFATEPGESKLSALQRFLESLNSIAWMSPSGKLLVGKPNMSQRPLSTFRLSREERKSNCTSMKAIRSATNIANTICPIWSGQETVVDRVGKQQHLLNAAEGPSRLRKLRHLVPKTIVVSTPEGSKPQDLSGINTLTAAGGANLLQAYAKREMARQNQRELIVQVALPGHYDDLGNPLVVDTVYNIEYDRGSVDEKMYLFQVEYSGGMEGEKTSAYFCRLGTIVSDVKVSL